ncbi:C-terminal binding protein [Caballeronia sp. J97]|uniref:C-terminal binding protein n=1 Tax=Caballeronia sp. J97 TaxID=2805429 RepID=UPI002AAF3B5F|nr:C-terminal binding protein [Caballeronia sp. J97]
MSTTILLTDYAWPDDQIERAIVESAGFRLVSGPAAPSSAEHVEALVKEYRPSAILTCWAQVSAAAITSTDGLRIVARLGVGLDNIDVASATEHGVWVTNVPDYCVEEVADHAVGFALAWCRGIVSLDRDVRNRRWDPSSAKLRRISTLTCGIVGFGRIGRATARRLKAFGCSILANTPYPPGDCPDVRFVDLDLLMAHSDIVIVHAPLTDETYHLINGARLALMRRGGLLINVSRGAVVDTDAVIDALDSGHLSAAALDVLETEPDVPAALLEQQGAILTPHVAFSSDASLEELRRRATEEAVRVLNGSIPHNACNRPIVR